LEVLNGCIGESLKSLEKMLQNNNIQIQSQPTTETTSENNTRINLLFNHQSNQNI